MISSVREIRGVNEEQTLLEMEAQFDSDLREFLEPLQGLLDQDILPLDPVSLRKHVIAVEMWRDQTVRLLSLASAFVLHGKGEIFRLAKGQGVTEDAQAAHQRHLTAGFEALAGLLKGTIASIDSRTMLGKKLMDVDSAAGKSGYSGYVTNRR